MYTSNISINLYDMNLLCESAFDSSIKKSLAQSLISIFHKKNRRTWTCNSQLSIVNPIAIFTFEYANIQNYLNDVNFPWTSISRIYFPIHILSVSLKLAIQLYILGYINKERDEPIDPDSHYHHLVIQYILQMNSLGTTTVFQIHIHLWIIFIENFHYIKKYLGL